MGCIEFVKKCSYAKCNEFNRNMSCIEIRVGLEISVKPAVFNRNMKCIEIYWDVPRRRKRTC